MTNQPPAVKLPQASERFPEASPPYSSDPMKSIIRKAEADWKGNLREGHGLVTTDSGALSKQPFSFNKRVDQGDLAQTNPEELIAAAISSCFSMALSKTIQDDDVIPQQLLVTASVTAEFGEGLKITALQLEVEGMVGDYSQEQLEKAVATTRKNCPVYLLLEPGFKSIEVTTRLRN